MCIVCECDNGSGWEKPCPELRSERLLFGLVRRGSFPERAISSQEFAESWEEYAAYAADLWERITKEGLSEKDWLAPDLKDAAFDLVGEEAFGRRMRPELREAHKPLLERLEKMVAVDRTKLLEAALSASDADRWMEQAQEWVEYSLDPKADSLKVMDEGVELLRHLDKMLQILLAAEREGIESPEVEEDSMKCVSFVAHRPAIFAKLANYALDLVESLDPELDESDLEVPATLLFVAPLILEVFKND